MVIFFFHGPLFGAFAGIDCHSRPNSPCTENNGAPVWRVRVVEGKRNGRVGEGPTLLPRIVWVGSRTHVQVWGRQRGGGRSWQRTSVVCQAVGHKAKRGQQATLGDVKSQKLIISTVLLLSFPLLSWSVCWQLAAANLLTPHPSMPSAKQPNQATVSWNLQDTITYIPFLSLKINHGMAVKETLLWSSSVIQ